MGVEKTQADLATWRSEEKTAERLRLINELAKAAGLYNEVAQVPPMHLGFMDYDKYMITIQGLAKIRDLHAIAQKQFVPKPPLGRL